MLQNEFTGFHDAARINAAIFFCSCHDGYCQLQCAFTVGGDAEHYTTVGANAAFLLLLVHVLPFTIMLGSTMDFFFLFSAHVRTATARYRALTTVRGDTALHSF